MELSRSEYPSMLASLQPAQASAVLSDRIKQINRVNVDIADWLQERRRIEEQYVAGLRKLSNRRLGDDSVDLGIFSTPWNKIVSATGALAESHHVLARKIESDVERPLRDFASGDREMQQMSTMVGNLHAMSKEVDSAQKQVEKQRQKGGKASVEKVAAASSDLDNAQTQWESQAPYVFEKLQQVDETRCNHLRDVLTQFQTHEVDQVERSRASAEETLNALLNIETADEIKTWSLRALGNKPTLETRRSNYPIRPPPGPLGGYAPGSSLGSPSPTMHTDDGSSQRSGSVQEKESRSHSGLSGLKRLGTVLRGKRQSSMPYGRTASPERKSATNLSPFQSFSGRSAKAKDRQLPPTIESPPTTSPARRRSSSHRLSFSAASENAPPSPIRTRQSSERPNGSMLLDTPSQPSIMGPEPPNGVHPAQIPELQEPLQPTMPLVASPQEEPQKESEFFAPPPGPPPGHGNVDPIAEAEREAAASASETTTPHLKVDIRNAPIQEEDGDAEAALANVANALRVQAIPPRKPGTTRGRRDVRNTMFIPSPPALSPPTEAPTTLKTSASAEFPSVPSSLLPVPASPPTSSLSPFKPPPHRAVFTNEDSGTPPPPSDTQSIRSGRSLSTTASQGAVKHPDMHSQGLNASIVEIASATFESGKMIKAAVIGEVALAYNPADISAPFGSESIRLDNFQVLEKVAPNPTFIENDPGQAGFYGVNLASITKTSVAFKYQIHLDDNNRQAYAPLLLDPHWKCEPKHSSVIMSYGLNPDFTLSSGSSITLSNVVIIVHIEGTRPTSAQSKPNGTLQKERSLMYWRIGDVTLSSDTPSQQIRARFFTEAEARPGKAEVRWEISGEHVTGYGSGLSVSMLSQGTSEKADKEDDPFADEGAPSTPVGVWSEIHTVKKITSGAYEAVPGPTAVALPA